MQQTGKYGGKQRRTSDHFNTGKLLDLGIGKYYLDTVAYLSKLILSRISSGPSVVGASVPPASNYAWPPCFY